MTPGYWEQACVELAQDARLAALMARFPHSRLRSRGEPFETLLRAIVGQQISTRAADAIWARLAAIADTGSPESLLALSPQALRDAGFSARKVEYACDLARHFAEGLIRPADFAHQSDHDIIATLTAVRGIGRWSAEMFLIFNLCRPDVWPVDDIGLQKAVQQLLALPERPTQGELRQLGERWAPWRTVVCWYLWRMLDPVEILY